MSKINAGTTSTDALVITGDTTGNLILEDGGGNVLVGTAVDKNGRAQISGGAGLSVIRSDASDSLLSIAYDSVSDSMRIASTYSSTGAYKPLTIFTSDLERLRITSGGNVLIGTTTDASTGKLQVAGNATPSAHNTYDLGTTAVRWKDVWCQTGAFNGSDARLKTEVRPLTGPELQAAKALSKEIGTYQWLESIELKGAEKARHHVGMTVQRAIEIMEANGLDPFAYGFIGYDKWDDRIVHHEAVEATEDTEAKEAYDEVVLKGGDAFSFRYDQLNQFIIRGIVERQDDIEKRLTALEK